MSNAIHAGQSQAVCVLGMSRSGTSLTARLLSLVGVYLGADEELLGGELHHLAGEGEEVVARAREANPGGFWEHYRLMRLNEQILKSFGGSWSDPPEMPSGWESSEELAGLRAEAIALLFKSFAGHRLWGWKDPRNSLTLPFWQRLVPEMRYVICLRNPLDVAASLERRDGMPIERGLVLWRIYVSCALAYTAGRSRIVVPYERYFDDPVSTVRRLTRFAGCDDAVAAPGAMASVVEAVDERLWRQRATEHNAFCAPRVPEDITLLYKQAAQLAEV